MNQGCGVLRWISDTIRIRSRTTLNHSHLAEMTRNQLPRITTLAVIILAAALTRLIPHPPNFTPIGAIAIFSGASFADRRIAMLVPLLAMLVSDLFLGFH